MVSIVKWAIFCFVCLVWHLVPTWAESKFALVVGNADYAQVAKLANPTNDARLVSDRLRSIGFDVTLATDLNILEFKTAIADFSARVSNAGPRAIVLFYYAGHGVQIDGQNYLLPIDADGKSAASIILHSVLVADILRAFEEAQADANVIVLDACRDNPFKSSTRGFNRGLAQMSAPVGTIIAYATSPGQAALDGVGENSPYATSLAQFLATPGISIEEVFKRVRIAVNEETKGLQLPWEETSLTSDVVIAPALSGSSRANAEEDSAQTPSTTKPENPLLVQLAFKLAVRANTVESYDKFIEQYPKSEEALAALNHIEALTDEQHWREATKQNTIGAYVIYLNLHRGGNYANEAQQKIDELRKTAAVSRDEQEATGQTLISQDSRNFVVKQGYDLYGQDYRTIKGTTFDECVGACKSEESCEAVTFSENKNWCFLKSGAGLLIKNRSAQTAYMSGLESRIQISNITVEPKTDIVGSDYMNFQSTDFGGCLVQCQYDNRCQAFSYVRKNHWCWLKSSGGEVKFNNKVDSGRKE